MRCASGSAQQGAATLVALLTVALVAGIATAALAQVGATLEGIADRRDRSQAALLAHGAIDWARAALAQDARTTNVDHLGEIWAVKVPPTRMDEVGGEVGGQIEDLSGRFNLNDLLHEGKPNFDRRLRFVRLATLTGIPAAKAEALAAALIDWMDADDAAFQGGSERERYCRRAASEANGTDCFVPPNAPLTSVEELAQVEGFDSEVIARLSPYVAVLPAGVKLNVNTAPPEVLAAMVPSLGLDGARSLAIARDRAWFKDLNDFAARAAPFARGTIDTELLAVASAHFLARGSARVGNAVVGLSALIERSGERTRILRKQSL